MFLSTYLQLDDVHKLDLVTVATNHSYKLLLDLELQATNQLMTELNANQDGFKITYEALQMKKQFIYELKEVLSQINQDYTEYAEAQ